MSALFLELTLKRYFYLSSLYSDRGKIYETWNRYLTVSFHKSIDFLFEQSCRTTINGGLCPKIPQHRRHAVVPRHRHGFGQGYILPSRLCHETGPHGVRRKLTHNPCRQTA